MVLLLSIVLCFQKIQTYIQPIMTPYIVDHFGKTVETAGLTFTLLGFSFVVGVGITS
jgi:hypothetical protein